MRQNKKLGQCFLKDKNIVKKAINAGNLNKNDIVLEIGLGKGILTKELAKICKKVIVIELDKNNLEIFGEEIKKEYSNVEIIWNDALKVNLDKLNFNKIVANLPYQISSPITFKLLNCNFDIAILMYQEEFAKRMVANYNTKEYGRLTVSVQYRAFVEYICKVPPTAFYPKPKVNSAIIKLTKKENPPINIDNWEFFNNFNRAIFQHKNKNIKKALIHSSHEINVDREILKELFNKLELNNINYSPSLLLSKKVYTLSLEEIGYLCNIIYRFLKNCNINNNINNNTK